MKITDGSGSSLEARGNSKQQLDVFAVVEPEDKLENRNGNSWTISASSTPVGANDYIFYFKNTSTVTYAITDVRVTAAAATKLSVDHVSGAPTFASGTDLTPVNKNIGKSNTVSATIKQDTNTTGLSDLGRLYPIQVEAANKMAKLSMSANIIIPPGQAIAMESSAATAVESDWSLTVIEDLV